MASNCSWLAFDCWGQALCNEPEALSREPMVEHGRVRLLLHEWLSHLVSTLDCAVWCSGVLITGVDFHWHIVQRWHTGQQDHYTPQVCRLLLDVDRVSFVRCKDHFLVIFVLVGFKQSLFTHCDHKKSVFVYRNHKLNQQQVQETQKQYMLI